MDVPVLSISVRSPNREMVTPDISELSQSGLGYKSKSKSHFDAASLGVTVELLELFALTPI